MESKGHRVFFVAQMHHWDRIKGSFGIVWHRLGGHGSYQT